jgi:hypothetical protein
LRYQTKLENHKTTGIPHKKQNEGCEMEISVPPMANCCGVQEKSRDKGKYFEIAHKT